jgi:hypothetical protein
MQRKRNTKKHVIVRCSEAGVWFGELGKKTSGTVVLTNARRLWQWWSIFTLSELAKHGPRPDKIDENRYAEPISSVEINRWCEIIPCTRNAVTAIKGVPNANQ